MGSPRPSLAAFPIHEQANLVDPVESHIRQATGDLVTQDLLRGLLVTRYGIAEFHLDVGVRLGEAPGQFLMQRVKGTGCGVEHVERGLGPRRSRADRHEGNGPGEHWTKPVYE